VRWDGEDTLFEFNFLAFDIPPKECFELAYEHEVKPGQHRKCGYPDHYTVGMKRHAEMAEPGSRWCAPGKDAESKPDRGEAGRAGGGRDAACGEPDPALARGPKLQCSVYYGRSGPRGRRLRVRRLLRLLYQFYIRVS
jgi:hypothetical protein